MPQRYLSLLLGVMFALGSSTAAAFGLQEAYRAAQNSDPQYRAARYEQDAGRQAEPMARAGLLPSLAFSAGATRYSGDRSTTGTGVPGVSEPLDYTSRQNAINLRMPLYNFEAISRYRQAESQVAYADSLFGVRSNELAVRVAAAYFDLLLARYTEKLAQSQVDAYQEQARLSLRMYKGGEGTRTEVAESESLRDVALAQLIEAKDQLEVARRSLQLITGLNPDGIQQLRPGFRPEPLYPATLAEWLDLAVRDSSALAVRRSAVEISKQEVSRNQAGHFPRLDFVAAYSRGSSESINTINQDVNTRSGGIQLNIPIFSGGYVNAATDQAVASLRKSEAELDNELNNLQIEVQRQFLATSNGLAKISAYSQAVKSSEIALEGTIYGLKAGTRTNLDVLDAQRRVFVSKRDQAQSMYNYLLASLKLKTAAGRPIEEAFSEIDKNIIQP